MKLIGLLLLGALGAMAQTQINVKQIKCQVSTQPQVVLFLPNSSTAMCIKLDTTSPSAFTVDVPNSTVRLTVSVTSVLYSDGETPTGLIDGVNNTFNLAFAPNPTFSLDLYKNGLHLKPGTDFTVLGSVITFLSVATPVVGDVLLATYRH